ncbi:MAG: hypothetical protein ACNYPE_09345 [Candidatus Azotimanducaceae bacterium WSBS_2022_MAG_OTU7]
MAWHDRENCLLCFKGDTELIRRKAVPASELLEDEHARYDFSGLLDKTDLSATELASQLWREVWEGRVSNDSIGALRRGIETEFKVEDSLFSKNVTRTGRGHRGTFNRWQGSMPFTGNWFRVPDTSDELDLRTRFAEQQELDKDSARLLLSRYGLVFRELCQRESAAFKWAPLFRALRLMELSGEVVSGRFFENIPGLLQYITATALGLLFQKDRSGSIFFINVADPISSSGSALGSWLWTCRGGFPPTILSITDKNLYLPLQNGVKSSCSMSPLTVKIYPAIWRFCIT